MTRKILRQSGVCSSTTSHKTSNFSVETSRAEPRPFLAFDSIDQGWQYGTPQFLLRSTVRFFCNVTGTVRLFRQGSGLRVRYVGTLFELKIPDFSHIAPAFCIQRQKTAETDAKCLN